MELEDIHSTRQDRASCRTLYQPVIITFHLCVFLVLAAYFQLDVLLTHPIFT